MLDKKAMRARAEEAFTSMGTDVKDLNAPVARPQTQNSIVP
jgi:hypothetical protein